MYLIAADEDTVEFQQDSCVIVRLDPPLDNPRAAASVPWNYVHVLVPNVNEARAVLDASAGRRISCRRSRRCLGTELGVPIVVTSGESGCVAHRQWHEPALFSPEGLGGGRKGCQQRFHRRLRRTHHDGCR